MTDRLWQAKLHARLHDPAEKALVLLRDPAGPEGGTSRVLHERLFPQGMAGDLRATVRKADWWASAADRPQFPRDGKEGPYARWSQVNFAEQPVPIHPLTGKAFDLRQQGGLRETRIEAVKDQSQAHFKRLLKAAGGDDPRRMALTLWRFGPELDTADDTARLGELWRFLPADTRIPDHSIWDHLDLVSAFAGAFVADANGECALLNISIGPVQEFIAAARTTSDLWAGSHLLARLSWEAMRVVCERLGPEAILFPRLRGIPQVDLWLLRDCGLDRNLFGAQNWMRDPTDGNPLFSAALPNRFLALVPASAAEAIAQDITEQLRQWTVGRTEAALQRVLQEAGVEDRRDLHAHRQLREQLQGFPEVHWAAVPYSALTADGERKVRTGALAEALRPFYPGDPIEPGFLGSRAWRVLSRPLELDGAATFYQPNPGVLYPAVYDLVDRVLVAAKSVRAFDALEQHGYRCSLTAEAEWLTDNPAHLSLPPGQRDQADTLWSRLGRKRPTWVRKGEHLGALATLKRLWPTLFCEELKDTLNMSFSRFVVSTHTMALATTLDKLGDAPLAIDTELRNEIEQRGERVALPRRLADKLREHPNRELIERIPAWIEAQRDEGKAEAAISRLAHALGYKPETYYALLLMDGDYMGAWLSGDERFTIPYRAAFHPKIQAGLQARFQDNSPLDDYLNAQRAVSPGRHLAISGALNDFSTVIAREVVEREHIGRVLYAGGDDLMAMFAVSDLLSAMRRLRLAYSGLAPEEGEAAHEMRFQNGFARRRGRLYLTMGENATASMGAVIAHHQAPLGAVLRALRGAEKTAKAYNRGSRDAFSLTIIKRAGGALELTLPWQMGGEDVIGALRTLSAALQKNAGASRRAAYNVRGWLRDLPKPVAVGGEAPFRRLLGQMLHYQFQRQKLEKEGAPIHAERLAKLCPVENPAKAADFIENMLSVAEFLARETRSLDT
ncbi:type III-B CRISPR-associated protein Cas10/Cmr2 [Nitrococcus mobilis]|uniref:Predicted hydrolase of the HD superfamily n=1 Tax=Nitrococcus mobilis Nb-231 TaxID=314278 RepID=A4BL66_9GAMM|nr:type III-B CRISPR-associated protein Cas10/Cmr2 [Nitrococcus mobilis]EAR23054.1 predicted hydrolase of the HD superfamily [Nitrococcus mobilis Nb-231]